MESFKKKVNFLKFGTAVMTIVKVLVSEKSNLGSSVLRNYIPVSYLCFVLFLISK